MKVHRFPDGLAIYGSFPDHNVVSAIGKETGLLPLTICDPPYGNIISEKALWDRIEDSDQVYCQWMISWTKVIAQLSHPNSALYVFGGVGKSKHENEKPFRAFFRYLIEVELQTDYELSTLITWKKKRAYGIQWGYLFTREELAYLVLGNHKKPRKFKIPLLDVKRGYAGYDERYPAKSEFFRRTNVWDDITEILRGKVHINQKPQRLVEIPIDVHTEPGEYVLDPFAGYGTTAHAARKLGRRFVVVEKDPQEFEKLVTGLRQ